MIKTLTNSKQQYKFIHKHVKEIDVVYKDLHDFRPKTKFDCAFFLESFTHLTNPKKVLSNLSNRVDSILIRDYIVKGKMQRFSSWHMHFRPKEEIFGMLQDVNYHLDSYEEILSAEDIRKSAKFWLEGFAKLNCQEVTGQLDLLKRSAAKWIKIGETFPWSIALFYAKKRC